MELESEFDIAVAPEDILSENFEPMGTITAMIEQCH